MKTGKEIKIENTKNYNIVFGSVNNKHPKAIYINISSWAEPLNEYEISYNRVIKDLRKKIKQSLFNLFESEFDSMFMKDKTIVDLDIRESGIRYGKRSFLNCEITLFLTSELPVTSEKLKIVLDDLTNYIIKVNFEENKVFKFNKKKK